jgi:putative endopeptidase
MAMGGPEMIAANRESEILTEIITAQNLEKGSDEWKIKELYSMYLDNDARTASISKLQPYFDEINAAGTIDELVALQKKYVKYFKLQSFYTMSTDSDILVNANEWCAIVTPGPLTMGGKEYYADDASQAGIQSAYKEMLASILKYMGETNDLEERAQAIFEIEKGCAAIMRPSEANSEISAPFVKTSWEEMLKITSVTDSLRNAEEFYQILKNKNIYCAEPDYVKHIESLYVDKNLQALKDIALMNVLSRFMSVLGDDYAALSDGFNTALFGEITEMEPIEARAQSFVTETMLQKLSALYAERYCSEEIKKDILEIIENIRDKYRDRINTLEWMSDETKKAAVEKLDAIKVFAAYPDEPFKTTPFDVTPKADGGCLIELTLSLAELSHDETTKMLGKPVEINFWESVPVSMVNAFYSPTENAICIPAGILQQPYYDPDASREQNLGAIGAVIAHEFTHAFDSNGAQYDKNGTLINWWADEDFKAFTEKTAKLTGMLSQVAFAGDIYVNGVLCVDETIADLGAMACVLDIADDDPDADLTILMEAWSAIWATRMPKEVAIYLIHADVHAPNKVRTNFVLSFMDVFYVVYEITESDGMYIPEFERVGIW